MPMQIWDDIYDATYERGMCAQFHIFDMNMIGSDDCLYLNVHTPVVRIPI